MSRKRHIALLIAFGPEVRAFVHSGLLQKLLESYDVSIITSAPHSAAFDSISSVPVLAIPQGHEPATVTRIRDWARQIHEAWMESRGMTRWRHYQSQHAHARQGRARKIGAVLARFPRMTLALLWLGRFFTSRLGTNAVWRAFYLYHKIDAVILSSYSSLRTLPALQTAANLRIKTFVVMNSWKDIYSSPYIQVLPTRLVVWNRQVAGDLRLANPHIPPDRVVVSDSLHLARFLDTAKVMDYERFCQAVGLDSSRPYVCYTAASPTAVKNEEQVVEALLEAIAEGKIPGRPQVLLRVNPMEDGNRFAALAASHEDLVIQRPKWEWDQSADWCCALADDTELWIATVYYAVLNVSIPSTVTLEFAAAGRSVVNICFDMPEALPLASSNRRFWEADFYKTIRHASYARAAFSADEMIRLVSQLLQDPPANTKGAALLAMPGQNPVERVCGIIDEALGDEHLLRL